MLEDRIIITVMYVSETISNSRPKIWDILPTELTNLAKKLKLDIIFCFTVYIWNCSTLNKLIIILIIMQFTKYRKKNHFP